MYLHGEKVRSVKTPRLILTLGVLAFLVGMFLGQVIVWAVKMAVILADLILREVH